MEKLEDLKVVWESLFPFDFGDNEFVEIAYDNKDKHFGNAVHIKMVCPLGAGMEMEKT